MEPKLKATKNRNEKMSYWQAKLYGHDSLSLSIHFPRPPRVRTLTKPQRLVVLAMAVKRSPKRLKYSTPRFTKVSLSLLVKTLFGCLENGAIPLYAVVMVLFLIAELVESVALISICLHCLNWHNSQQNLVYHIFAN